MRICPQCGTRFQEPTQFCPHDGSQTYEAATNQSAPTDPLLGRVIDGRYRIEQKIGEGGMGMVYMATHSVLQKKLALKVLRGDNSRDAEVVQRFMQEAQAATSIGHPNIIDISDFGRLPDGSVYFVMEYLDGSVPLQEAVHLVRQIASALEAAHARGIVHRDLKPDNIFIVRQGADSRFVKVLDFGVAKVGGAASKLTKTGMVFGTPHYMSPEQAAGHSVDQRTDIYALGVIMYEMFTGKVPFDADTFMGILSKHMFEVPPRPTTKGASLGPIENVVLRTLEKNPDHRYQAMGEVLLDLEAVAAGGTVDAAPRVAPPPSNLAGALDPAVPMEASSGRPARSDGGKGILLVALAVVALLAVGGAVGLAAFTFSMGEDDEPQAVARAEAPAESPPTSVEPPARPPEPSSATPTASTPAASPPAAATPTPPPAPSAEPVRITIQSDPPGAEVLIDGVMVGNTPAAVPRPTSGTQAVTLRMRDHEETTIQISPQSSTSLSVTLARARQAVRSAPRRPLPTPIVRPATSSPSPMPPIQQRPAPPAPRRPAPSEVVDPWQ